MNIPTSNGLLVLDKPGGMTSREALDRASLWFPRGTRLGHTGTLDPLATGVLVVCSGVATRLGEYVQDMTKVYRTCLLLGASSDTDDADGVHTLSSVEHPPTLAQVLEVMPSFVGEIDQIPPAFSAAKVTGRRAYALARRGETVTLRPRKVMVKRIDVLSMAYPILDLEIECGKGTYVRSLARDLGERLGCGALVQRLRRLRVGNFTVEGAVTLDADRATALAQLLPVTAAVAGLPVLILPEGEARRFCVGQRIVWPNSDAQPSSQVAVFDKDHNLIAIGCWEADGATLRPVKVMSQKE